MTRAEPMDDFASRVLDVVDSIPPGRVMSYGDIAEYLRRGPGPRQVGRVMSVYGGAVPWWRVIRADGAPPPGHDPAAPVRPRGAGQLALFAALALTSLALAGAAGSRLAVLRGTRHDPR